MHCVIGPDIIDCRYLQAYDRERSKKPSTCFRGAASVVYVQHSNGPKFQKNNMALTLLGTGKRKEASS